MLQRLLVMLLAGGAAGVVSAVIIAVGDLYLTGHGYTGLTREYLAWPEAGIHLSIGDIIMLVATLLAAAIAWWAYGRA